jgi:hypothetical protein
LANLENIQAHALFGFHFQHGTQPINLFAALPYDDTRFGGMNGDRDLVSSGPFNLNP